MQGIWMEITCVLEPEEYRMLRKHAEAQSLGVANLVSQIIRHWLAGNQDQNKNRSN